MEAIFKENTLWFPLCKEFTEWMGTPYGHLQAEKGKKADCGLFIVECLKAIGVLTKANYSYFPRFALRKLGKNILIENIQLTMKKFFYTDYYMRKVTDNTLLRGDILTFKLRSDISNHIALYFGNDLLIHSIDKKGVNVSPFLNIYKNRLTNKYRIYK